MIAYELARGLAYRRIRHREMHWYRTTIPAAITVVFVASFFALPVTPQLLGSNGLLTATLGIVSTLPGFYFAGLAAVATFPGLNMDRSMLSGPVVLVKVANVASDVELSRRQFLSYLFSYLVLISFVLCIAIVVSNAAAPSIDKLRGIVMAAAGNWSWVWIVAKFVFVTTFAAMASSIVVTTLHGMFFLTERIHQP